MLRCLRASSRCVDVRQQELTQAQATRPASPTPSLQQRPFNLRYSQTAGVTLEERHHASAGAPNPTFEHVDGRYRLEAVLGRGGMGEVYRALDERTGRLVALKRLCAVDAEHEAYLSELFHREYRTLAQLRHPSIVEAYEYGVCEGKPYYTMELLSGQDLYRLAPLSWQDVCRYGREVSSALALLHSRRLVHRDVSPRNIRCEDGRAKLFDFGAMAPMGSPARVVGTPQLVPPEALHGEALDGRYDLFALGGALYWALTREHVYSARDIAALPAVWQRPVVPLSRLVPGIPESLDALILSMLSLEVDARPRSAAEVMEALSAIAGLPTDEQLHVSRAYLTTPALVGRDAELSKLRAVVSGTAAADSCVVAVMGELGVGRSRLLDAAAVEARLVGGRVLQVNAGPVLCSVEQLARALLEQAIDRGSNDAGPQLREVSPGCEPSEERAILARTVVERVRELAAEGLVLVAVDDADQLDAVAQDLLEAIIASPRSVVLLMSCCSLEAIDAKVRAHARFQVLQLATLNAEQTERLMRSMFGEVPGLSAVTAGVHRLSRGNPRATLELAQHLVDTQRARYVLGGWVLPTCLESGDLPEAWTTAIDARLHALERDEREMVELLAFALPYALPTVELQRLTAHGAENRWRAALDGLVAKGFVRDGEGGCAFVSAAYAERARALCSDVRARWLHRNLSRVLAEQGRNPVEVADHLLLAHREEEAIGTLIAELKAGTRSETAPGNYAEVLERAIEACDGLYRPTRERFTLLHELTLVGSHLGVAHMRDHFIELAAQLERDSGLADYAQLDPALDEAKRLELALSAAQQRYERTPEHERVCAPLEAIRLLVLLVRHANAYGAVALDYELVASMPDLTPFVVLSPAIAVSVQYTMPAAKHLLAGRYEAARESFTQALARFEEPDGAGLEGEMKVWAIAALHFALGHLHAGMGLSDALTFADSLERTPRWEIGAWDVRRAFYLRFGDWNEAESCRARVERMRLQSRRRPAMVDTSARLELDTAAHAGNLTAAQRAVERMSELIPLHSGYAPYAHFGPASTALLRGQYAQALQHAEEALRLTPAGRHPTWSWVVGCLLEALLKLGRHEEVTRRGYGFESEAKAVGLGIYRSPRAGAAGAGRSSARRSCQRDHKG